MAVKAVPPPEEFNPAALIKHARAWCPYCAAESDFGHDSRLDYARCMGCGISERDYYVRQYNRLWADNDLEKFTAAVKRSKRKYTKPFPWEERGGEAAGDQPQAGVLLELEQAPPEPEEVLRKDRLCARCGATIVVAVSNRQRYCRECGRQAEKERAKARKDRQRRKTPASPQV